MQFFRLLRSGVDVDPLLAEVRAQKHLWLANTSRQDKIAAQRDTNTIFLRSAVRRPDLRLNENQETRLTEISNRFPLAVHFMTGFAAEMDCSLSRATIVRLKPHSRVIRHTDAGSYYLIRDRYHLVLYSAAGTIFRCADEQVRMQTGDLWWFNNKEFHDSYNDSNEWRIHYIFDLLPHAYEHLAKNPMALGAA